MKFLNDHPKLKNPYFWLALIGLIFASAGIDFNTLTSWKLLGTALLNIVENPVSIVAVVTALIGIWNDNGSEGLDKINKNDK